MQVNGKVRDKLTVSVNITKEELETMAKESSRVQEFTEGKNIVKVIYVPGKLVNIVVKITIFYSFNNLSPQLHR